MIPNHCHMISRRGLNTVKMHPFERFRRSKPFLLFVTFYSVTVQLINYSVFHPILPFYLRELYTTNNSVCAVNASTMDPCWREHLAVEAEVSKTIGMVTGTGSAMQLVTSLFSGILLQKFSLHINLILSVVLNLMAPSLAFFATGVITLCMANAAISAGSLLTFITYYSILSERSSDDKERMRLVSLYNVFNGLGNVIGYSAASASYQFLGHKITFAILFAIVAIDLVIRCLLKCPEEMALDVEEMPEKVEMNGDQLTRSQLLKEIGEPPEIDDEDGTTWRDWLKYISDPYVVLVNVQTFLMFISICTLCTTGPHFVSTDLQAEQWQIGLAMGIGSTVELIMLSTSAALVTTHARRWFTIFFCCLLNAAGFFWYPFTSSIWEVLIPETFIRVSKAVGIVFIGTLYPYITDCRGVGDCKMGYAIHGVYFSIGATLGSFGAGLIVVSATFQWLYVAVGTCMLVCALTVLPFIKLAPKEDEPTNLCVSRVSLASFGHLSMNTKLSVNNLHRPTSMASLRRTRSISALSHNNLTCSMADMTLSRLSVGRGLAL